MEAATMNLEVFSKVFHNADLPFPNIRYLFQGLLETLNLL